MSETPVFSVETIERGMWRVSRTVGRHRKTVHITQCRIEAQRMRDELERADKAAFYEGLLVGRDERAAPAI